MKIKNLKLALISFAIGLLLPTAIASAELSGPATGGDLFSGGASLDLEQGDSEQTVYCPDNDAWHAHAYENTTGPKDGYEYYMIAHRFRMYLHDDFMENIDVDALECSTTTVADDGTIDEEINYVSCAEGESDGEGGTTVRIYTDSSDSAALYPDYIEWTYGTAISTDKTLIAGYNDYDGDGTIDTEDAKYRTFGEIVDFDFNSDVVTGDSATTTSAIEVRFWRYDQSCGDFSDYACWEEVAEDGVTGKHWNTETYTLITDYECEEQAPVCAKLSVTPGSVSVADVYDNIDLDVTAYDTSGADMTGDTKFDYEAYAYSSSSSTPDAEGYFGTGIINRTNRSNDTGYISDHTVSYKQSTPGDKIYIYEETNPSVCNYELELPYCTDLDITNPALSSGVYNGDSVEFELEIDVDANYDESTDWPYDINYGSTDYDATWDGNATPWRADQSETDWDVDYYSEDSATITVQANDDVANLCSDTYSYTIIPPIITEEECASLSLSPPISPISVTDMNAGDVEITWVSAMTDGTPTVGPWRVWSTNSSGTFRDSTGTSTGEIITNETTVYYTGTPGDTVYIEWLTDPSALVCSAVIESIPELEAPYCEEMLWQNDYPYSIGTGVSYDMTVPSEIDAMYDESVVCFDWWVNVFDLGSGFTGTLVAEGWEDDTMAAYNGQLRLNVNETGGVDGGNPATLPLNAGVLEYTGTVCWQNFEEGNYLSLYVAGEEDACYLDFDFPILPEKALYCVDLEMTPDSIVMEAQDVDAGIVAINITYGGNRPDWEGTLIVESRTADGDSPGAGELHYTDGSPSMFADGHLEIPVLGVAEMIDLTYVAGQAGDTIVAYIDGDDEVCIDEFTITQEGALACYGMTFEPNSVEPGEDATVEVCTDSDLQDQNLRVLYTGCDEAITYNGTDYYGELLMEGIDGDVCFDVTFNNICEDAVIETYIEDWEDVCWDEITVGELPPVEEELYCIDLSFDVNSASLIDGEDLKTELTLTSQLEDNTVVMQYTACNESMEVEFNGVGMSGDDKLIIPNVPAGITSFDVTFKDVCADAEINAYVVEDPEVCADDLETEVLEVGEFSKFIFTFNFIQEQNAYSRENVFFSHDEDRAFYTLEYNPAGSEDEIVFTDDMWQGSIEGHLGGGEASGGYVSLATSYDELTSSSDYQYQDILKFGFGDGHEANSDVLAATVKDFTSSNYMTFIPYVKFNDNSNQESFFIPECDGIRDDVCFEPSITPEDEGKVLIRNAGKVKDLDEDAVIRIRYVGVVDSTLTRNGCSDVNDDCLTESFRNSAEVKVYEEIPALKAEARLVVLCSYLVTRNAGDVYLEVNLRGGSDISCIFVEEGETTSSQYRNADALVILDSSGGGSASKTSYCDDNDIGSLSSYVCEIINSVSDLWTKSTVESTTESRVSQATRNAVTTQARSSYDNWQQMYDDLYNQNNPNSGILYYQVNGDTITLGNMEVPEGAWTLIVEDADLILNGDINYKSYNNINDIPSIAFVVLGGDIYVGSEAHELSGVFYTNQSFDGAQRDAVDDPLTFYGSIYGHIQPLLDAAKYVGSPNLDGGGIVVRYDSRILLNTPPALSEYVDIHTEKGVN